MEWLSIILITVGVLLIVRALVYNYLLQFMKKKVFEQTYLRILHSPEFKVKSKYD